ncbi:MAG: ClbS/DfsB family four-helix bundle protein [Patescibacteria group bacterium]
MSRARNKQELLNFGETEFKRLFVLVDSLSDEVRDKEFVFSDRTTKDIVAHLYAWQLLELRWYKEGMSGKQPAIPAPGYSFKDAPALNEKLYLDYQNISWQDLKKAIGATHKELMKIIASHSDEDLTVKKKYKWTGSTNMASYFASALSSHYVWAIDLIAKKFKQK